MITLERFGVQHQETPKGKWQPITSDGEKTALIYCPNCGDFKASLAGTHKISEEGIVTPSLVCGNGDCDFHEHIKLQGWV